MCWGEPSFRREMQSCGEDRRKEVRLQMKMMLVMRRKEVEGFWRIEILVALERIGMRYAAADLGWRWDSPTRIYISLEHLI